MRLVINVPDELEEILGSKEDAAQHIEEMILAAYRVLVRDIRARQPTHGRG